MALPDKERKKHIAEESPKTRKAREKLKRQLDAFARHASHRVALKSKSISLFDENQNAAGLSMRVSQLADQIKKDFPVTSEDEDQAKMSKLRKIVSK
jgi:hypothetical protein